jgi:hypothetical protein
MDLGGADWFCVAFLSGDKNMIDVFKSGKSPHLITGRLMSGMPEDIISREDDILKKYKDPVEILTVRQEKIPEVFNASFLPRTMSIRQAAKKCLVNGTEVLTPGGWKAIELIKHGDLVAQWHDFKIFFAHNEGVHSYLYENEPLIHFNGSHLDQTVTLDHRMPVIHSRHGGKITAYKAQDIMQSWRAKIPVSGFWCCPNHEYSLNHGRLLAILQSTRCKVYGGYIEVSVQRPRSPRDCDLMERLKDILKKLEIPCAFPERFVRTVRIIRHAIIDELLLKMRDSKLLGTFLLQLDQFFLEAFLQEAVAWSPYQDRRSEYYVTTNKINAEWVQTIAHIVGKRASITVRNDLYKVRISSLQDCSTGYMKKESGCFPHVKSVHCLTVPSGFFLVRHNGKISVTGNSNHGGNYREGVRMFAMTNEIDEKDAKMMLDRYTCQSMQHGKFGHNCGDVAYPGIRDWWDKVDAKIRLDRTLVNCFGRKVYFSGQMGEDLFKQAYSFVPQSTVFDITAKAMKLMMDDDSEAFKPAQLRAQVHDSLLTDYLSTNFSSMLRYTEDFVLKVTLKGGMVWRHLKDIPIDVPKTELADRLEICWKESKEAWDAAQATATSSTVL